MSTQNNNMPSPDNSQPTSGENREADAQKSSEISLPKIDRPEGPFPHSGETARMTEEEKEEKMDEANQSGNDDQGQ